MLILPSLKLLEGIGVISSVERETAERIDFQENATTPTDPNTDDDAVTRDDGEDTDPNPNSNGGPSGGIKLAIGKVYTIFFTICLQAV
jgi:hypothetical protein